MSLSKYISEGFKTNEAYKSGGKPKISNFVERKTVEKLEKMFDDFLDKQQEIEFYLEKGMHKPRGKKDNSAEIKELEKAFDIIRKQQNNLYDLLVEFDNYVKNGGKL